MQQSRYQSAEERHYAEIFTAEAFRDEPDWYREAAPEQYNELPPIQEHELAERFEAEAEAAMDQPARPMDTGRDM